DGCQRLRARRDDARRLPDAPGRPGGPGNRSGGFHLADGLLLRSIDADVSAAERRVPCAGPGPRPPPPASGAGGRRTSASGGRPPDDGGRRPPPLYFGPLVLSLVWFWRPVCRLIHRHGEGMTLVAALAVPFSLFSESRCWIAFVPVLVPFAIKVLDEQGLPSIWYCLCGGASLWC